MCLCRLIYIIVCDLFSWVILFEELVGLIEALYLFQMNRRHYESYICKRVPGKQAVVVMACDNRHMNDDMLLDPGLVMIFAHGIE